MNDKLTDYSFEDIISQKKIRIPMIQRDYAEGRKNKKVSDIRKNFINELLKPIFGKVREMKLDFVYGYDRDNAFEPLDGQQRLTTLFLLYWIFRPKDLEKDILRNSSNPLQALFTYATRITSEEFCNALVSHYACDLIDEWKKEIASQTEKESEAEDNKEEQWQKEYANISIGAWFFKEDGNAVQYQKKELKLSDFIKSKDWFEWGWRKDPSINSMLVVMDEVMSLIGKNNYSYTTMVYPNLSHITFNLLDLDKLEMSDELYVKMNSRGKNLSSFDILKSTFEEEIQLQGKGSTDFEKSWREKVDGKWMYYFWQNYKGYEYSNQDEISDDLAKEYEKVIPVERNYLKLLQRLVALRLLISTRGKAEYEDLRPVFSTRMQWGETGFDQIMQIYLDMSFGKTGNKRILDMKELMNDMDSLIYEDEENKGHYSDISKYLKGIHFDGDSTLFESYLKDNINYDTIAMFDSMLLYARKFHIDKQSKSDFRDWMRFTRNTVLNDNRYDRIDKLQALDDTLLLLQEILDDYKQRYLKKEVDSFVEFIDKYLDVNRRRGIENERVAEEKKKAKLRLADTKWNKVLDTVEENDYLTGQVCSLLSWSDGNINKFEKYYYYFKQIVGKGELKDQNKFYAAMLTLSDYRNKTNHTLYTFNKQRDRSLKQYLRIKEDDSQYYGVKLKELIDYWIGNYEDLPADEFFDMCIKNSQVQPDDWRFFIIHCPQVMNFAREKIIVQGKNGYWYLRSKIRSDVEHREIYIESLGWRVIQPTDNDGNYDHDNPRYANVIVKGNTDKDDPDSFYLITKDEFIVVHIRLAGENRYELKINDEPVQNLSAIDCDKVLSKRKIITILF